MQPSTASLSNLRAGRGLLTEEALCRRLRLLEGTPPMEWTPF
jgi:hypothetical protein